MQEIIDLLAAIDITFRELEQELPIDQYTLDLLNKVYAAHATLRLAWVKLKMLQAKAVT